MPGYVIHRDKCRVISPPFQSHFLRYSFTVLYITYIFFYYVILNYLRIGY